jgi:hypothetical protein
MFSKTTDSVAEETDIQRPEQNNQPDNSEAWGERPKYVSTGTVGSVPLGSHILYTIQWWLITPAIRGLEYHLE